MANLTVYKDTGELLFDTNLISYGLISSGYMVYFNSWTRKTLKTGNIDPTWGGNWNPTVAVATPNFADQIHGFTVYNAISPVAFIVGSGVLAGTQVSGNATTFFYSCASPSTKFYCFDLMADNIGGGGFLKTWTNAGRITFNSLQPPLNVVGQVQAPGPPAPAVSGHYLSCYAGGGNRQRQASGNSGGIVYVGQADSYYDVALGATEYAAFLPWSRSCTINDLYPSVGGFDNFAVYAGAEGAYGRYGGMTFMFGASAGTTTSRPSVAGYNSPISYDNIPTDRYPIALLIDTAQYPFPYN